MFEPCMNSVYEYVMSSEFEMIAEDYRENAEVFDEDGNQVIPIKEAIINPDELPF